MKVTWLLDPYSDDDDMKKMKKKKCWIVAFKSLLEYKLFLHRQHFLKAGAAVQVKKEALYSYVPVIGSNVRVLCSNINCLGIIKCY